MDPRAGMVPMMDSAVEVLFELIGDAQLPAYQTADAAGMDLRCSRDVELAPGQRQIVPTGLKAVIPSGFEGQVRPRSGLAAKHGIGMVNAPGTIDADYRGEIGVILINWGQETVKLSKGERIAQLVIAPVIRAEVRQIADVTAFATERGEGGFGSTGK